ncbi:MAG: TauD/TfdA family dioxygenase, partial [Gammaproteobacteria bacterium]
MRYQLIEVEPLTPTIGAIVHGADLPRPVDDETFSEIHDAWMEHLVLFFRNQPMANAQHLEFGMRFGPLHIHPAAPYADENP